MDYTELLLPLPELVTRADEHYKNEGLAETVRAYALAAIAAAAPAIRRAERKHIQKLIKRRWKGGYPGEVVEDLVAAIRSLPEEP